MRIFWRRWWFGALSGWPRHRIDVDGLQAGLLFFELVKRRAMLAQAALQLGGERRTIVGRGCPGQRIAEPVVFQSMFEGVLAQPPLE